MEPGSLPCLNGPTIRPYPEPVDSIPYRHTLLVTRSILISSSHVRLCIQSGLFHSGIVTKILYSCHIATIRSTRLAHLILVFETINAQQLLVVY